MTIRGHTLVLALGGLLGSAAVAAGQPTPFALPLDGTVTQVETTTLGDARNDSLRTSLEQKRDLAAKAPGVTRAQGIERVLGKPDTDVVRIRVRFANLPQRAMAPVLLANNQVVGHAVGGVEEVSGGVEVEFLVVPQLVANLRFNQDAAIEVAVRMGEDARTKSVLRSDQAARALRDALAK